MLRTQGHTADAGVYFHQAADMFERVNNLDGSADCLVLLANNYNLTLRPAVVMVREGRARLAQRRETHADLVARDVEAGW